MAAGPDGPTRFDQEEHHGQDRPQAPRSQEEGREPRQAPQRLSATPDMATEISALRRWGACRGWLPSCVANGACVRSCPWCPPGRVLDSLSNRAASARIESRQLSVIWTWTSRIWNSTRCAQLVGRRLGAGAGDDRLHGALEVVLLQARVAVVEVDPDRRAVGLVELVVDEVDDPVEEVGAVARGLAWSWLTIAPPFAADGEQVVGRGRSPRACRAAGAGRGAAGTSRCRSGCP